MCATTMTRHLESPLIHTDFDSVLLKIYQFIWCEIYKKRTILLKQTFIYVEELSKKKISTKIFLNLFEA